MTQALPVPRDHRRRRAGLMILGVGLTAVAAFYAAAILPTVPALNPERQSPNEVVALLTAPQTAADRPSAPLPPSMVEAGSTRYLGMTPMGRHYVGVSPSGLLCLATVAAAPGVPVEVSCTDIHKNGSLQLQVITGPAPNGSIALLRDGTTVSAPWRSFSPNLAYKP